MSSGVNASYRVAISYREIPEGALSKKLLGMIPIVGGLAAFVNELGLLAKISKETDREWLIQLIEIKNEYKVISVARSTLELGIGCALMSQDRCFTQGAIFSGLSACCLLYSVWQYYNNAAVIEKLQSNDLQGKAFLHIA